MSRTFRKLKPRDLNVPAMRRRKHGPHADHRLKFSSRKNKNWRDGYEDDDVLVTNDELNAPLDFKLD